MGSLSNFPEDLVTRVRKDILMESILRRHELEKEVIREMMLEKDLLPKGEIDWGGLNQLQARDFGGVPFQRAPQPIRVSAAKPIIDVRKEWISPLTNRCSNKTIDEKKRKLEAPEVEEEGLDNIPPSKKLKKEWKCDVCQITTTSKQALEEHIKGRKHKSKEKASLISSKNEAEALADEANTSDEAFKGSEDEEKKEKMMLSLEASKIEEEGQDNIIPSKKTKKDWKCDLCQLNTTSELDLEEHFKGRKHKSKEKALLSSSKNEAEAPVDKANTSDEAFKVSIHEEEEKMILITGKNEAQPLEEKAEILDVADKAKESTLLSSCNNKGQALEGKAEITSEAVMTAGGCNEEETENVPAFDAKFWCQMCSFGTDKEEPMMNHREGKHHMSLLRQNGGCLIVIKTIPAN